MASPPQCYGMPDAVRPPSVSCIIPAFNAAPFVGEAIESALEQTRPPQEILVVDDGSTDRTVDVVRSFGTRLAYLHQRHLGVAAAMNTGVRAASGTHIAFLNADDLWRPEKLARQMTRLVERAEIHLCFTQYRNFWVPELVEEERLHQGSSLSRPISGWSASTLLTPRETFEHFGLFEESGAQQHVELVWALRAAQQGAIVDVIPDVLMDRRLHPGNLSRRWAMDDDFFQLVRTWRDFRRTEKEEPHEE
ncbi:MAG: glycosyltransferase family A protein [Candidatus Bipolaricaulis sp.]|nr:glycosyltransferase family A protein [Candidatus Bipolaricaulis sp.]